MGMPYATLMPIFADRILHGGARGLGLLMGASGLGRPDRRAGAGVAGGGPRPGALGGAGRGGVRRSA